MKRQLRTVLAAFAIAVCPHGVGAQDKVISIPVDKDFERADIRWSGAHAGGYDSMIALKGIDGQIALCGVGIVTNSQLNTAVRSALRGGVLRLDGEPVIKNFLYFAKAPSTGALTKTKANCKLSGVSARKRVDVDLKLGNGIGRGDYTRNASPDCICGFSLCEDDAPFPLSS